MKMSTFDEAAKRAAARWHTESLHTQLLRALAEAEERDAAVEKRARRIEIPAVSIMPFATHAVAVNVPAVLELLCVELAPGDLWCKRLEVRTLTIVEGASLELLNRAWLSRVVVPPGVGVLIHVENRGSTHQTFQGCLVGLEPAPV